MRIFITGATGFVGTYLTKYLKDRGYEITVLTRHLKKASHLGSFCTVLVSDPGKPGQWQKEMIGHDIVINLAGASIFTRWTSKNKNLIMDSRINTTQNIVQALSWDNNKVKSLLSTSAVGFYGFREDEVYENSPPGNDFLAIVTRQWEERAKEAEKAGVRVVLLRFGIVLGKDGGALKRMLIPFKLGIGAPLGSGRQWFPWIHINDLARIYEQVIENEDIKGPINCTAPFPVSNKEFTKALGQALKRPIFLPSIPGFVIKAVLGEFGTIVLKGQKALPKRLLEKGFVFEFPTIQKALEDLVH